MVNTEVRLIIFFAAKGGEALYSQQKQDWELKLERKYEFSHEVRRGAQGASRVAPGKSGVYACDEIGRAHV